MCLRLDGGSSHDAPRKGHSQPRPPVIASDFDNDGYEELSSIIWGNRTVCSAFGMAAGSTQSWRCGLSLWPRHRWVVGDFNRDGRLECSSRMASQVFSRCRFFAPHPNLLIGCAFSPYDTWCSARGAIVKLHTRSRTQNPRERRGSGYLCQMEPVATFGLGPEHDKIWRLKSFGPMVQRPFSTRQIDRQSRLLSRLNRRIYLACRDPFWYTTPHSQA